MCQKLPKITTLFRKIYSEEQENNLSDYYKITSNCITILSTILNILHS